MLNDLKSFNDGFDRFGGNEPVVETVKRLLRSGRLPHAVLIEGDKGLGKETFSRLLAAAAVCSGEEKPCGKCRHCLKAAAGNHPDIRVIAGGNTVRSLHVDAVREVRQDAYILPNEAVRKVYVFLQAGSMTEQAQNALLKILEEPPASAFFILTCEMRAQLLDTVVSRVSAFTLREVDADTAVRIVSHMRDKTEQAEIRKAYERVGGNIGRILSELDEETENSSQHIACKMMQALISLPELEMLKIVYAFERDRTLADAVLDKMLLLLRDACIVKTGGQAPLISGQAELCRDMDAAMSLDELIGCSDVLNNLKEMITRNANGALLTTRLSAELYSKIGK